VREGISVTVHPNDRINRELRVPILEEYPAISVPGDVIPLCSDHAGRSET